MSLTPTRNVPLGYKAPDFNLPDTISGKHLSFSDVKGKDGTVVMVICNHCPFVVHVMEGLIKLANDYKEKGMGFVAISSNDVVSYPQDSPELMKQLAIDSNFPFPYLYDESQQTARDYMAECTPDFSIFDKEDKCVYRGQLDHSRPRNGIPVTGKDIREVCEVLLQRKEVPTTNQSPSIGCNIKWK